MKILVCLSYIKNPVFMKPFLSAILAICLMASVQAQTITMDSCITSGSTGNIAIFANYDGGVLNINVDQNIPNLKIGVCTYEPVTINLSGPFVNNVTEVRYAGYVSTTNNHCSNSPTTTTIVGAPGGAITNVLFLPPATLSNPNGYSSIVCAFSCNSGVNQGGCNTADQIQHYFETTMGGTTFMYFTQYGCWSTTPYNISSGGNCPLPTVNDTTISAFTSSASAACAGSSLNFTDISPNAVSWSWTAPGSTVPSSSAQNLTGVVYNTAGTYTVTLTVNDGDGTCSTSQVITIFPEPSLNVTATPNPICEGDSSLLEVSGGLTYQWSPGGPAASSWLVAPTMSTMYSVDALDVNGCSVTDSILVMVIPALITPTITYMGGVLYASPTVGISYQWYLNGVPIPGATLAGYTPTANGDYTVTYMNANGCESAVSLVTTVTDIGSGVDDENLQTLVLYPNPTKDQLMIEFGIEVSGNLLIHNASGQVVINMSIENKAKVIVNTDALSSGVYHVSIVNNAKQHKGSFVKQ